MWFISRRDTSFLDKLPYVLLKKMKIKICQMHVVHIPEGYKLSRQIAIRIMARQVFWFCDPAGVEEGRKYIG